MNAVADTYETKEDARYIPENYISTGIAHLGTAASIDPLINFNERQSIYPVPIWNLQVETRKFTTPKPISVKIYREEDFFFAENDFLAVCGTGESQEEAIKDFAMHIVHFYEYYKEMNDANLTGDALKLKDIYNNLLEEEIL